MNDRNKGALQILLCRFFSSLFDPFDALLIRFKIPFDALKKILKVVFEGLPKRQTKNIAKTP